MGSILEYSSWLRLLEDSSAEVYFEFSPKDIPYAKLTRDEVMERILTKISASYPEASLKTHTTISIPNTELQSITGEFPELTLDFSNANGMTRANPLYMEYGMPPLLRNTMISFSKEHSTLGADPFWISVDSEYSGYSEEEFKEKIISTISTKMELQTPQEFDVDLKSHLAISSLGLGVYSQKEELEFCNSLVRAIVVEHSIEQIRETRITKKVFDQTTVSSFRDKAQALMVDYSKLSSEEQRVAAVKVIDYFKEIASYFGHRKGAAWRESKEWVLDLAQHTELYPEFRDMMRSMVLSQ